MKNKLLLLIAGTFLSTCLGCAVNPVSGDKDLMLISPAHDIEMGRKYAPEIEKQLGGRITDDDLQKYLDNVGQRLVQVSHAASLKFHFTAVDHKSLNACALPGGYIFITRGLLEKLQTEAQLASILSHEIVHVVARHTAEALSRQLGMSVLMLAAIVASPTRGTAAATQVTAALLSLRYSRDDEREADRSGLLYLVRAGYDPHAGTEVMQLFSDQETDTPLELWSSHPMTDERLTYLKRRVTMLAQEYDLSALRIGRQEYQSSVLAPLKARTKSIK